MASNNPSVFAAKRGINFSVFFPNLVRRKKYIVFLTSYRWEGRTDSGMFSSGCAENQCDIGQLSGRLVTWLCALVPSVNHSGSVGACEARHSRSCCSRTAPGGRLPCRSAEAKG